MKYLTMFFILSVLLIGCKNKIGDSCSRDMDCNPEGGRTCDGNQPGGYCLIITCAPDDCPGEAACAEFVTPAPEFDTDSDSDDAEAEALYTQLSSNRTRTYCLRKCTHDKDCRSRYHCALDAELDTDLNGMIIDSKYEGLGVCVPD